MTRPNLEVITGALTHRILFDGDRAVGVEISRNGQLEEIRAEREVILSAGAYNTPVIMMLSGIGPAADLEADDDPGARGPAGRREPPGPPDGRC